MVACDHPVELSAGVGRDEARPGPGRELAAWVLKPPPEAALNCDAFAEAAEAAGPAAGVLTVVPPTARRAALSGGAPGRGQGRVRGFHSGGPGDRRGRRAPAAPDHPGAERQVGFAWSPRTPISTSSPRSSARCPCRATARPAAPAPASSPPLPLPEVIEAVTEGDALSSSSAALDKATEINPRAAGPSRPASWATSREQAQRCPPHHWRRATGPPGWYVEPMVFADVANTDPIAREEIFDPVPAVIPYERRPGRGPGERLRLKPERHRLDRRRGLT